MLHLQKMKWSVLLVVAALATLLVTNRKGDAWEEYVRNGLYTLSGDSIPDFAVDRVDSLGIPYTYYPTQNGITPGNQYNATIVCNYALAYFDTLQQTRDEQAGSKFLHCLAWLQQNMSSHHDAALFKFHWQQPWYDSVKTPFTSGMTSGLAIQVYLKAYQLLQQPQYVADAAQLARGFAIPVDSGGFTFKEPGGWWFEEIADTGKHTPRILDGHVFALLGLYDFSVKKKDTMARQYFERGEAGLRSALASYDAGDGQIAYDKYGKLADKKYKRIITQQMEQMWHITGDTVYWQYLRKWRAPMERPYMIRAVEDRNRSGIILMVLLFGAFFACLKLSAVGLSRALAKK